MYPKQTISTLIQKHPLLQEIIDLHPVTWINPNRKSMQDMPKFSLQKTDMLEAARLWERFAPYFKEAFPETASTNGILESPLKEIPSMKQYLDKEGTPLHGKLYLKCDNALPIAGSIKARGGFFEILQYAEKLALEAKLVEEGADYTIFNTEKIRQFFSAYTIGVGSTGNLGLSIGILSAKLGFQIKVYVSGDAKQWKKDLLRKYGVEVIEFEGDFSIAINAGREETKANPKAYFVDDEDSEALYLGYSIGALRLAKQLEEQKILVDAQHPLFVYLPCGVGGSPGGTSFGLKQIYGDNVHCFFVEPTHSPAVITGLITQKMSAISVQDIGIDNRTEADGLAVGRPSKFATEISNHVISGIYTIEDDTLYRLLSELKDSEDQFLEPSATAGLIGPQRIASTEYSKINKLNMTNATHIAWATGGDLVPQYQRELFYNKGKELLQHF